MKIRVPATSANLGPGFDSCGLALDRYLVVELVQPSEQWLVEHQLGSEVPNDEENLLIQTALQIAPELPPWQIRMTSDIPLARGLGSSSSVIVAGIELANRLGQLNLTSLEKLKIATKIEGHPDNVAPAILGDLVIAAKIDDQVEAVKHWFPKCTLIAFIPAHELLTKESRNVLPESLTYRQAVEASSIANVMIAALVRGDLVLAGKMMENDRWHENYRKDLVPHLDLIRQVCHEEKGYGCYLSGAGPTVLIMAPEEQGETIYKLLVALDPKAKVEILQVDREGVQVF
ncbi:MAG: homoserine kinase [Enterococcus sp.]